MSALGSLYIKLGEPDGELCGCTCEVGDWAAGYIADLTQQRDKLLAALEKCVIPLELYNAYGWPDREMLRREKIQENEQVNADQKKRAQDVLNTWRTTAYGMHADAMAALLQELIDAPEAEPVAYVTGYNNGYPTIAPINSALCMAIGTALYSAPPVPSVPDGWRDVLEAVLREMPAHKGVNGNAPGHSHRIAGIWDDDNGPLSGKPCAWCITWNKAKAMLAAAPTPPEPPAAAIRTRGEKG